MHLYKININIMIKKERKNYLVKYWMISKIFMKQKYAYNGGKSWQRKERRNFANPVKETNIKTSGGR